MVVLVNVGAVAIAVLFSVLPALRAAMLPRVRALRYECGPMWAGGARPYGRRVSCVGAGSARPLPTPARNAMPLLSAVDLHKTYRRHLEEIHVLRGVDLDVEAGELLAVVGASGSGKSTLLHLLGTLDRPDRGEVRLDGKRVDHLPSADRDRLRNEVFGYVFQFYHLLPELTALENVVLPQMIARSAFGWLWHRRAVRRRAAELLERVGLGQRLRHRPRELSGGEMQRAAVARALMNSPRVLLADEPTGNLDADNGAEVVRLLRDLNRQEGLTIIMVTHNLEIVPAAHRVVRLTAGRVEGELALAAPASEEGWRRAL
jgi:lipoprotein-releasing system ATP-binding protein